MRNQGEIEFLIKCFIVSITYIALVVIVTFFRQIFYSNSLSCKSHQPKTFQSILKQCASLYIV